jgi:hypothetical protein
MKMDADSRTVCLEGNTLATNIEARVTQHDREIAAIRKLLLTGMKMLNQTQIEVKKVAVAQQVTEKKLQALIDTVRGAGSNGHGKTDLP